jgi:hypothetical protein
MICELCHTHDSGGRRICQECIEMVGRVALVDEPLRCGEPCADERVSRDAGRHDGAAGRSSRRFDIRRLFA